MSGSTDGLVNIYDTSEQDEDNALISVLNHGASIHHADFLDAQTVGVLSHDETLAIYAEEEAGETTRDADGSVESAWEEVEAFGDLRPLTDCAYAVDLLPARKAQGESVLVAGNCRSVRPDFNGVEMHVNDCTGQRPNSQVDTIEIDDEVGTAIERRCVPFRCTWRRYCAICIHPSGRSQTNID